MQGPPETVLVLDCILDETLSIIHNLIVKSFTRHLHNTFNALNSIRLHLVLLIPNTTVNCVITYPYLVIMFIHDNLVIVYI